MGLITDTPPQVFYFGLAMVLLVAAILLFAALWGWRNAQAIGSAAPVDTSDLSEGYRLVRGRTAGPRLKAPLTGRSCVWWQVEVWESRREREPDNSYRYVWTLLRDEASDRPIRLGDGRTLCEVLPLSATVIPSQWSRWEGDVEAPRGADPELHDGSRPPGGGIQHDVQGTFGPRFRYQERYIWNDVPLFALGHATLHGAARTAGPTPDPRRPMWAVEKQKGRPFLISTRQPDDVASEHAFAAQAALPMGLAALALAAVLLYVRSYA